MQLPAEEDLVVADVDLPAAGDPLISQQLLPSCCAYCYCCHYSHSHHYCRCYCHYYCHYHLQLHPPLIAVNLQPDAVGIESAQDAEEAHGRVRIVTRAGDGPGLCG